MERKGRLFAVADRVADLILLGLVWSVTSVPLLTLGTSCTALYYAVSKSVRFGEGRPLKEYFLEGKCITGMCGYQYLFDRGCVAYGGWMDYEGKSSFLDYFIFNAFSDSNGYLFFPGSFPV